MKECLCGRKGNIKQILIPVYCDKKTVDFVKNRNGFAKLFYEKTGKILRPLFGNGGY